MSNETAVSIAALLDKISQGAAISPHVIRRIAAMTSFEEPEYADVSINDRNAIQNGRLVIFTPKRVVYATWEEPLRASELHQSTVSVRTWRRSDLSEVIIERDDRNLINLDQHWDRDYGDLWPPSAVLNLVYQGQGNELRLPLASSHRARGEFYVFVAKILQDLC